MLLFQRRAVADALQDAVLHENGDIDIRIQLVHQVGGDNHGTSVFAVADDFVHHLLAREDVHAVERLVKHHHLCVAAEGERKSDFGVHAGGERANLVLRVQLHALKGFLVPPFIEVLEEIRIVLACVRDAHIGVKVAFRRHVGNVLLRFRPDRDAIERDFAAGLLRQSGNHLHQRRLAASVRTQQRIRFPLLEGQGQIRHRQLILIPARQVLNIQHVVSSFGWHSNTLFSEL